ncbi:MAG: GNAT family N-acetyltransferase, partial [Cytophagaceae bacterium]
TIHQSDHLWIENVAVAPHRQGQGWGKQLLVFADRKAVRLGCHEIRLLTNEAFATNVALYERSGYRIDKKEPFELGGVVVYMSKKLHSSALVHLS